MSASESVVSVKVSTSKENSHENSDDEKNSKNIFASTYDSSYGTNEYLAAEFINSIVEKVADNQESLVSKQIVKPVFETNIAGKNSENTTASCSYKSERSPKFVLLNKALCPLTSKNLLCSTKSSLEFDPLIKEHLEAVQTESEVDISLSSDSVDESSSFDSEEELKPSKGTLQRFKAVLKELKGSTITKHQTESSLATREKDKSFSLTSEKELSLIDSINSDDSISSLSCSDQLYNCEKVTSFETSQKGFKITVLHENVDNKELSQSKNKHLPFEKKHLNQNKKSLSVKNKPEDKVNVKKIQQCDSCKCYNSNSCLPGSMNRILKFYSKKTPHQHEIQSRSKHNDLYNSEDCCCLCHLKDSINKSKLRKFHVEKQPKSEKKLCDCKKVCVKLLKKVFLKFFCCVYC